MVRKSYTLLIFNGAHGEPRKLQVPFYVIYMVCVLCAVGITTMATLASTYARMLFKVSDYNYLRAERELLQTRSRTLEDAINQTNAKLDSLQSVAGEVALSYGFVDARRPQFPPEMLQMAMTGHSAFGPTYCASLHAFNLLKTAGFATLGTPGLRGLPLDPLPDDSMTPSIWPARGPISAGFGQRMDPFTGEGAFHAGVDIAVPTGTPVRAAADGLAFFAGPDAAYGNMVMIDHGYGYETKYGHLSKIFVVAGQEVKQGQVVGAVGMTGRTTGPHLHYEVRIHGTPVNPARYLRKIQKTTEPYLAMSNYTGLRDGLPASAASR